MLTATREIRGAEPIDAALYSNSVLELPDFRLTDRPRCAVIVEGLLRADVDTPHRLIGR